MKHWENIVTANGNSIEANKIAGWDIGHPDIYHTAVVHSHKLLGTTATPNLS